MQAVKPSKTDSKSKDLSWLKQLDLLRRSSGIKIDHKGVWWHEKQRFEHPKIIATLNRGLAWKEKPEEKQEEKLDQKQAQKSMEASTLADRVFGQWYGEAIVHVGEQWCYIDCQYTPFLIHKLKAKADSQQLYAVLNNEQEFVLGPLGLKEDILYSRLAQDRLARFSVHAQIQVMEWLEECAPSPKCNSGLKLVYQEQEWPIISI